MKRSLAGWLLVFSILVAHSGCDSQNLAGPELVSYEALQRVDGSLTLDDERKHVVAVHFASPRTPGESSPSLLEVPPPATTIYGTWTACRNSNGSLSGHHSSATPGWRSWPVSNDWKRSGCRVQ